MYTPGAYLKLYNSVTQIEDEIRKLRISGEVGLSVKKDSENSLITTF